jgi:hypothetical protein
VETQQETAGKLAAIEGRLARLEEGRSALEGVPAAIKDSAAQLEETTKALDGRLARVEEGQTAQQGFPAAMKERAARLEETSKALGDRLARVEETQAARADFPDTIKARVARLEETIKTLGAAAANGGDVAQTAAVAQQISDLSARLDTRLATLRRDVDALGARLDALPEPGADQSIAEDLARRVTALERKVAAQASAARTLPEDAARRLAELERKVGALAEREPAAGERLGGAALAVRFAALTRAIDEGAPFARELGALREIAPPGLDLSGLARQAQRGAPTVAVLARRFEGASRTALEAAGHPHADQSLIGQILTNARSLVRVRRIDGAAGDSPAAVLTRMAAALKTGDLKAAVDESQKLPESSREALGPWLDSARARLDLEAARERVAEELGRRLAGGGSSGAREQAGDRQ